MNAHRLYKTSKRKREVFIKKLMTGCFIFFMVLSLGIIFDGHFAAAHGNSSEEPIQHKYYKSIEVHEGDTLWGIAETYMATDSDSIFDYIDEVKEINGLDSDLINESQYLTVAYYDAEFR